MSWSKLPFSKYEGKTLPQIAFRDPDWLFWAVENGVFKTEKLKKEAEDVSNKSQQIRIPETSRGSVVEYFMDPMTGKLADVRVVNENKPPHQGSSKTFKKGVFDLSAARNVSRYDKKGGEIIAKAVKYHYFGSASAKMTEKRCQAFFDDADNFV